LQAFSFFTLSLVRCEISNCTSHPIAHTSNNPVTLVNCNIHDNAGYLIRVGGTWNMMVLLIRCLITKNQGVILAPPNPVTQGPMFCMDNCTVYGCTGSAFNYSAANALPSVITLQNNIIYGSAGWGIICYPFPLLSGPNRLTGHNNAWGANLLGDASNYIKSPTDITLTANPFKDPSVGDYSLNPVPGGGQVCRGQGWQWGSP
jgi:hypothetical protein